VDKAQRFQETLYRHNDVLRRDLPWRRPEADGSFAPYKILVSEIMLQQTQVSRVIPKYETFLKSFPTVRDLARSPLSDVLAHWSGLGYNRRAKYLHEAARHLQPKSIWLLEDLIACKGIGYNTAAAVLVYAYNQPHIFIETNVRTVYIHHFFADKEGVDDKEIIEVLKTTYDYENPREFCWALMDYGSHLKSVVGNLSRSSRHYTKQSKFEGSLRQIRGQVLRQLIARPQTVKELEVNIADKRLETVLLALEQEGLVRTDKGHYRLP
jgi:A/G-specific adenine glycosylase